jgi:hypothetical protein
MLRILCLALACCLLAACAVREVAQPPPTATPPAALVIAPPPPQIFVGACSLESRNWEFWLQAATFQAQGFRERFVQALTQTGEARVSTALELAGLRDAAYRNATPECGVPTQLLITGAMDRGVEALRISMLDEDANLLVLAGEVNAMLDLAFDSLKVLTDELEQALSQRSAGGSTEGG